MAETENIIDPKVLRKALGEFATGVTVITTREEDDTPRGFTANSFTSVSLDPPLILVSIAKAAASCDVFVNASHFAVNVLCEEQKETSGLFATQRADKFNVAEWSSGKNGTPLLDNSLAWFECAHHQAVEAGDHILLIGRVVDFEHDEKPPLGFFRGSYFSLGVENSLVEAIGRDANMIIGAVFEKNGRLLLEVDSKTGEITVPSVGKNGTEASVESLKKQYGKAPLNGTLEFIYAVFEDSQSGSVTINYRGHATGAAPSGTKYFGFDEIPWDQVKDIATNTMLKRYVNEARSDGFAIYMGDELKGDLRKLS